MRHRVLGFAAARAVVATFATTVFAFAQAGQPAQGGQRRQGSQTIGSTGEVGARQRDVAVRPTPRRVDGKVILGPIHYKTMKYEVTVDDPGAYTATWTAGFNLGWDQAQELFEYVCQENNFAPNLMVGAGDSRDRVSPIVP